MNLGFEISYRGIDRYRLQFLSFTWLVKDKPFTFEIRVTADPDFAAIQLEQMADAIKAKRREEIRATTKP